MFEALIKCEHQFLRRYFGQQAVNKIGKTNKRLIRLLLQVELFGPLGKPGPENENTGVDEIKTLQIYQARASRSSLLQIQFSI